MRKGFTKTGQPIQGRRYRISQGDVSYQIRIVGKGFGPGGNADLRGIFVEDEYGRRDWMDWPIEPETGSPSIRFEPMDGSGSV